MRTPLDFPQGMIARPWRRIIHLDLDSLTVHSSIPIEVHREWSESLLPAFVAAKPEKAAVAILAHELLTGVAVSTAPYIDHPSDSNNSQQDADRDFSHMNLLDFGCFGFLRTWQDVKTVIIDAPQSDPISIFNKCCRTLL